jgi:uncharacterized protein YprB with RNaseH-like and TPR domain
MRPNLGLTAHGGGEVGLDFSTALRRKLSSLRRAGVPAPVVERAPTPEVSDVRPAMPGPASTEPVKVGPTSTGPAAIPGAIPGAIAGAEPTAWTRPVDARSWVEAAEVYAPPPWRSEVTSRGPVEIRQVRVPLPSTLRACAVHDGSLYLDTETLGLGSQPVFLVGLARVEADVAVVEQIYARDYGCEAALLDVCRARWQSSARVVTYNGKSYDLPLLRDRMTRHRLRPLQRDADEDLVHAARRRWKHELPDCRLQTIERLVLARTRQGDVPGHEIPERYHRAVRSGDDRLLGPVFVHNVIDLLTLIEIHPVLADAT